MSVLLIKPSTSLRNDYNEISKYCKEKKEPVYLTKNGEGDLVVMSIDAFEMREEMLDLRQKLLEAEAQRLSGCKTFTIDEVRNRLKGLINEEL